MNDCVAVLALAEEMAESVRRGRLEEGFIACRTGDKTVKEGSFCTGDDECIIGLPACENGKPFASFHTHETHGLQGRAAEALLVPSPKDLEADREVGVKVGCVGGNLNDGTGLVWCFPTDRDVAKITDIVAQMNEVLEMHPFAVEGKLTELVDEYLKAGRPCSVLRFKVGSDG